MTGIQETVVRTRKMQPRSLPRWLLAEDEAKDFQNIEMDMDPKIFSELSTEAGHLWDDQLDVRMIEVPRAAQNKFEIGNLLKCTVCRQFPYPADYYFCENEIEAHMLCRACFEDKNSQNPKPTCTADMVVSRVKNQQQQNVKETDAAKKCGQVLYAAEDQLYDAMLGYSSFSCIYRKFRCNWTGTVDAIHQHAARCDFKRFLRDELQCPVTNCKKIGASEIKLIQHLKKVHKTVIQARSGPISSFFLDWDGANDDSVWVPAVLRCPGLYLMLTLEIKRGRLFQWLYAIETSTKLTDTHILTGFRQDGETGDKMVMTKSETKLREESPEFLGSHPYLINRKTSCFSIKIEHFIEKHTEKNRRGEVHFTFDMNVML